MLQDTIIILILNSFYNTAEASVLCASTRSALHSCKKEINFGTVFVYEIIVNDLNSQICDLKKCFEFPSHNIQVVLSIKEILIYKIESGDLHYKNIIYQSEVVLQEVRQEC